MGVYLPGECPTNQYKSIPLFGVMVSEVTNIRIKSICDDRVQGKLGPERFFAQMGPRQIEPRQIGPRQIGPLEILLQQIGPSQPSPEKALHLIEVDR